MLVILKKAPSIAAATVPEPRFKPTVTFFITPFDYAAYEVDGRAVQAKLRAQALQHREPVGVGRARDRAPRVAPLEHLGRKAVALGADDEHDRLDPRPTARRELRLR